MPVYARAELRLKSCYVYDFADDVAEVETLRGELAQAKEQARVSKAAADKAAAVLETE